MHTLMKIERLVFACILVVAGSFVAMNTLAAEQIFKSVDADGNEVVGIRLPEVSVPIATYAGWNLTRKGFAEGALCSVTGSTIPFAETRSEREATKDPRPSIEERYESHEAYVQAVEQAARHLVTKRLLLEDDVSVYVEMARQRDIGL